MAAATLALMTSIGSAAAAAAPTVATIGSTISSALPYIAAGTAATGAIASGIQAKAEGDFQAKELKKQGDEAFAEGQQRAQLQKRQMDLARSSLRAREAASGAGDSGLDAGLIEQGDYNQMVEFYQGKSKKSAFYGNAASARISGRNALKTSVFKGISSAYDIVR